MTVEGKESWSKAMRCPARKKESRRVQLRERSTGHGEERSGGFGKKGGGISSCVSEGIVLEVIGQAEQSDHCTEGSTSSRYMKRTIIDQYDTPPSSSDEPK